MITRPAMRCLRKLWTRRRCGGATFLDGAQTLCEVPPMCWTWRATPSSRGCTCCCPVACSRGACIPPPKAWCRCFRWGFGLCQTWPLTTGKGGLRGMKVSCTPCGRGTCASNGTTWTLRFRSGRPWPPESWYVTWETHARGDMTVTVSSTSCMVISCRVQGDRRRRWSKERAAWVATVMRCSTARAQARAKAAAEEASSRRRVRSKVEKAYEA